MRPERLVIYLRWICNLKTRLTQRNSVVTSLALICVTLWNRGHLILWKVILWLWIALWISWLVVVNDVVCVIIVHVYYIHLIDVIAIRVFLLWCPFLVCVLVWVIMFMVTSVLRLRILNITLRCAIVFVVHIGRDRIALSWFILLIAHTHSTNCMQSAEALLISFTANTFKTLLWRCDLNLLRSLIFLNYTEHQFILIHCKLSFNSFFKFCLITSFFSNSLLCQTRLRLPWSGLKLLNLLNTAIHRLI